MGKHAVRPPGPRGPTHPGAAQPPPGVARSGSCGFPPPLGSSGCALIVPTSGGEPPGRHSKDQAFHP
eukprot:1408687-Lingulodinium_polyedra.AAC.1